MIDQTPTSQSSTQALLSKVSRYEALFELAGVINAAEDIESVGQVLAKRLKYIVDIYSWRYVCTDGDPDEPDGVDPPTIVIDGHRGRAEVTYTIPDTLSDFERQLWRERKTYVLCGDDMLEAIPQLPGHLQKDDLEQISANMLVEKGKTRALYLFGRRRQSFTDLDIKCLAMVTGFFHTKIHMLWEQQKLWNLEQAYVRQEVTLRQSERLATLGRLSAGMAHELNNPTAVARQGAEQLRVTIEKLEQARFALGAANLSGQQHELIARLESEAEQRAKQPSALDPIVRSDLEQEVEDWLETNGVEEPWVHASVLVTMGLCVTELEDLTGCLSAKLTPTVIDYFGSRFTAYTLLEEIGHGTERIAEIVKALKGYSYMDQAPVQAVDVREGLQDTLVMLSSKLREGIKVECDFADDLPSIEGYGSELNQVWTNLIDNAIGAMNGKGAIELKAFAEEDSVVVEVADNGPGIPLDVQSKIFDPFFTTKAPGEGTGLGLNISHGIIVEKHGGTISVCSKSGATRFTIKLPVSNPTITNDKELEAVAEPS